MRRSVLIIITTYIENVFEFDKWRDMSLLQQRNNGYYDLRFKNNTQRFYYQKII